MTNRERFEKEYCEIAFQEYCYGRQVDCDKCYSKFLESELDKKDAEIENLKNECERLVKDGHYLTEQLNKKDELLKNISIELQSMREYLYSKNAAFVMGQINELISKISEYLKKE